MTLSNFRNHETNMPFVACLLYCIAQDFVEGNWQFHCRFSVCLDPRDNTESTCGVLERICEEGVRCFERPETDAVLNECIPGKNSPIVHVKNTM